MKGSSDNPGWRLALLLGAVLGCATPAQAQDERAATGAAATQPSFELKLDAPPPLADWLRQHVELARYQELTDLSPAEIDRLLESTPDDLRQLLGTQGYFSPRIEVQRQDRLVQIRVEPGPATRVSAVTLTLEGEALQDPAAATRWQQVQRDWRLAAGQRFTQAGWDDAKSHALQALQARRYPAARLLHSRADIDPETRQAQLQLTLASGPAYTLGEIEVEGESRYDAEQVRRLVRLAGVTPGSDYDAQELLTAQQRLIDSGYFESAFVLLDTEAETDPTHATVHVRVREALLQKLVVGVGVSTDNGPRLSLEHVHHRVPGLDWRATSKLQLERDKRSLGGELSSPVDGRGWRWDVAAQLQRLEDGSLVTDSQQLRAGRSQTGRQLDRQLFVQYDRAHVTDPALAVQAEAASSLSINHGWTLRSFDSLSFPTRGQGLALELGGGLTLSQAHQPYLRTRVRWQGYLPQGEASERPGRWSLRLEGGAVWSRDDTLVPATQRFLAGGDNSVRGYALRSIGVPRASGGVDAGRLLAVASLEWQRPLWFGGRRSEWESALFLDAGSVADHARDLEPQVGVGAGLRYHSPVGPLQLDLAYGLERKAFRLHMSVGFTF